jgi:hypothetical protein
LLSDRANAEDNTNLKLRYLDVVLGIFEQAKSNWRVRVSACPGVTVAGLQDRLRILQLGEG